MQKQVQVWNVARWALGILLTGAVAWTTMKFTVSQNSLSITVNSMKLSDVDKRVRAVENCVIEQKVQNEWMKDTLTRIEKKIEK